MKTTDLLKFFIDPKFILWYSLAALYLPLLNLVDGPGPFVVALFGNWLIVGTARVDPGRARLYGITRARTKRYRFGLAVGLGLYIIVFTLPHVQGGPNIDVYGAIIGFVAGLVTQTLRHPEDSFEATILWSWSDSAARSVRHDVLFKPLAGWYLMPVIVLAINFCFARSHVDSVADAFPNIAGYSGAMFAGMVVLMKNQLRVAKVFGTAPTTVFKQLSRYCGLLVVMLWIANVLLVFIRVESFHWWELSGITAAMVYLHIAMLIGAFRKWGITTPMLLFAGIIIYSIVPGISGWSDAALMGVFAATVAFWIIMRFGYLPRRVRSGYFGSTGYREMMGVSDKISL